MTSVLLVSYRCAVMTCLACAAVLGLSSSAQAATTRSGTLHAIVTDNFRTGQSTTRYILKSGTKTIQVRPTALAAEPGDRVAVTGEIRDGRLVGDVEATSEGVAEVSAGPRRVAVLHLTFSGEPDEPWSLEEMRSKVFNAVDSANAFYQEESYGDISLTGKLNADGDVFGWLSLDTPTDECSFFAWKAAAEAAAAAEGIDLTGYEHVVYVFPQQSSCSWLGLAVVGGNWSMINGNLGVHPIAHELGHNLGLEHAGSLTCFSGGVRVQISNSCATNEYGDPFDVMGNIAPRHSNGWNLDKLGLLSSENIATVEASGTYSMRSALHPTSDPTLLRVPRGQSLGGSVTPWYYLEVRENGGVFENIADASTTGVSIRVRTSAFLTGAETALLDANPATATFADAPLGVGQTFAAGPVTITTEAAGAGSATVSVEIDEEPPSAPTGLTATVGLDGVRLQWGASTDNVGVDGYLVFRDGAQIGSPSSTSFLDSLASVGDHTYVVYAEDFFRNRSAESEPATVTVPERSGPVCGAGACTATIRHSGEPTTWTVPPGIDEAEFTVEGARGGDFGFNLGGRVVATLGPLVAGEAVAVSVGGRGKLYSEGGAGGFNGGGDGTLGAGGGGFSSVELGSTLMLLAGGGGGRGLNGVNAITGQEPGGGSGGRGGKIGTGGSFGGGETEAHGATLGGGDGGARGGDFDPPGAGGNGGEVTGASTCEGGAFAGAAGDAGESFEGGGGAPGGGGGGGGGYFGGGQGGGAAGDECGNRAGAGGGGGGSSYAAPGLAAEFEGGVRNGDGQVSITYSNPIAAADHSYTTSPDQELVVSAAEGLLSGASAPSSVPLAASVASAPAHGDLTLDDDGSFTFTPAPGYVGGDSFTYRAADPAGNYATAQVALMIAEPPTASISAPSGGRTYMVGQSVPTAFSCSEGSGGTGLSSCNDSSGTKTVSGGAGRLDTSTVGLHAYAVTAVSEDGLTGTVSISYMVVPPPPFPPIPPAAHTLSVTRVGGGSGTVSDATGGISCPPACSRGYPAGTQLTLAANPAPGSRFAGWSGSGCAGSGDCRLTIGADTTLTARFAKLRRRSARLRIMRVRSAIRSGCATERASVPRLPDRRCAKPRIAIRGTIARRARGAVRVKVSARLRGRRVTATKRARVRRGRWGARLAIPWAKRQPKARLKVTARFGGSPGVRGGYAKRRVVFKW